MRVLLVVCLLAVLPWLWVEANKYQADVEDNDFAEFEEFDDDELLMGGDAGAAGGGGGGKKEAPPPGGQQQQGEGNGREEPATEESDEGDSEDESMVEDDESEFDHFQDEEEFEGFDGERVSGGGVKPDSKEGPKITITKVPLHLRTNWDSFFLEILMLAGLFVYFLNFFAGKSKNQRLANAWFNTHRSILEENFSLVGDDGKIECDYPGLIKESENMYTLWCSGRTCVEGMLVELKFIKRQDLVAVISQMLRPTRDQVHIKVRMNKDDMDTFVFYLGTRKSAALLGKELADLSTYCPEKKSGEKFGVPSNFIIMSELGEVTVAMLDSKFVTVLNKYADLVEYVHFSDQYSGAKQPDDTAPTRLPDSHKMLIFSINIPTKGVPMSEAMEQMRPLVQLIFYCIEKVKRFRLSKEGKAKADKNRSRVEEAFLKTTHAARAEAAAARREEKRRQEKERIMQEDDPEKQRKWEEREMRRQMKKKAPKMKQLKVKAL